MVFCDQISVGTGRDCRLRIQDPRVSRLHANLVWSGGSWRLWALLPRCPVWVGNSELAVGIPATLRGGERLAFGAPELAWHFFGGEPRPLGIRRDGHAVEGEDRVLALPGPEEVLASFYEEGPLRWTSPELGPVEDGDRVEVGGESWQLQFPRRDVTIPMVGLRLDHCRGALRVRGMSAFHFLLRDGPLEVDFGERACNELLYWLARAREEDRAAGIDEYECGWRLGTELARRNGKKVPNIALWAFHLRTRATQAGVLGGANLVEPRERGTELRIGLAEVSIEHV